MTNRVIRPCGLVIRENRLLLLRYRYNQGDRYNLPGGNLEAGEELHACLVREFREELDLSVTPGELRFVAETRTQGRTTLHMAFQTTHHGTPRLNTAEVKATELLWLEPRDLENAPLYPAIGFALTPWLTGHGTPPVFLGTIPQPWLAN